MPTSTMSIIKRLIVYIIPYIKWFIIGQLAMLASVGFSMVFPWVVKDIFDTIIQSDSFHYLGYLVIGLTSVFMLQALTGYLQMYFHSLVGEHVVRDLRVRLYEHLQRLSLSFYTESRTGDLTSRMTNDINLVQGTMVGGLTGLIRQVVTLVMGIAILFYLDPILASISFITLPAIIFLAKRLGQRVRSISRVVQFQLGRITTFFEETIQGIVEVKAYVLEGYVKQEFRAENDKALNKSIERVKVQAGIGSFTGFLNSITIVIIMGYGGYRVMNGLLSPGELIAFILYIETITGPISGLMNVYSGAMHALGAAERVFDVFDSEPEIVEDSNPLEVESLKGKIEFKDVHFEYIKGQPILEDINMVIEPGTMVALVGPSGVGKSTLSKLVPRFYDASKGCVLIDDVDIRRYKIRSLRQNIGIVSQSPYLFGITVRDNIACGNINASMEEIREAAIKANAHEFISSLEKGYDTEIGEKGVKLSGGQRQRIAIARAFLKNPAILILDEATSSLDNRTEKQVQYALEELMKGRTTLVIAHRLTTIINADKIVVMDEGKIIETGRHEQLMELGGLYCQLYKEKSGRAHDEVQIS